MAKKKMTHQPKNPKQEAPHQHPIGEAKVKTIDTNEASEQLQTLKSLNTRLVKEIVEMRQQIDYLVRDKEAILEELNQNCLEKERLDSEKVLDEKNLVKSEGLIENLKREIEQIVREKNDIASVKSELEVQNDVLKKEVHKKKSLWTFITYATTILTATCIVCISKSR